MTDACIASLLKRTASTADACPPCAFVHASWPPVAAWVWRAPIGTPPWYYETGLVPTAIRPWPRSYAGDNGGFSWDAGSRLYFTNLTSNFPIEAIAEGRTSSRDGAPRRALELDVNQEPGPVVGFEAIAVSRAANVGPGNYNVMRLVPQ